MPNAPIQPKDGCYANSWAVVIGINDYRSRALRYAVPDAAAVAEALLNLGFPSSSVFSLHNAVATRQNIQDLLSVEMARKAGTEDRLLVFYAGHGRTVTPHSGPQLGYLVPIDADEDRITSTGISMNEIRTWSSLIPAKHILFVMDCCYSGLAATRAGGLSPTHPDYFAKIISQRVRQIITAGEADQQVIEDSGQGLFTRVFIQALRGDADILGRGYVTGSDLGQYLTPRVYDASQGRQKPIFRYLEGNGDFVFTLPNVITSPRPKFSRPVTHPQHEPTKSTPTLAAGVNLDMTRLLAEASYATDLSSSSDGAWLATMHQNRTLHLWRIDQEFLKHAVISPRRSDGYLTACSLRHSSAAWELLVGLSNGVECWQLAEDGTSAILASINCENVVRVQFSPDGARFLIALGDGRIEVRDSGDRQVVYVRQCNEPITTAAFCLGGSGVVSGSENGNLLLWTDRSPEPLRVLNDQHDGKPITALAGLASTPACLSASEDGILMIVDAKNGNRLKPIDLQAAIACATWDSSAGLIFAGVDDETLRAIDMDWQTETWRRPLPGLAAAVAVLADHRVAVANFARSVEILDCKGSLAATLIGFGSKDWLARLNDGRMVGEGYERFLCADGDGRPSDEAT
jgi:hypothetical protein